MKRTVIGSGVIVAAIATAVALAVASAGPSACTLAGCSDGIVVFVAQPAKSPDRPRYIQFCAEGKCNQVRVSGRREWVHLPCPHFDGEQTVALTGRVLGPGRRVLSVATKQVNITSFEPNGHECGPTCWTGHAGFDVREGAFIPAQRAQDANS